MTTRHERARREADPSDGSLVSFSTWHGADGVVILDTSVRDDLGHRFQARELEYVKVSAQFRRADELDAEAAYYAHRAMQQEQARGPSYYVGLLRALATDRAAMAQRLRTGNEGT
jgi:hypothetical protein